jgi:hypothetical protein
MPSGGPLRNEYTSALAIPNDLAVEVNFQFALKYEASVTFLAPVRLDKLGRELDQAYLPLSVAEYFESSPGHCLLPL